MQDTAVVEKKTNQLVFSFFRLVRFWSIDEKSPQAIGPLTNGLCCAFSTNGSVLAAGYESVTPFFAG